MWKKISAIVIPTAIAVALICFMLCRVWGDLLEAAQYIVPAWLLAAVAVCVGAWFLRGFRYQHILKRLETEVKLWFSTACIFVSQTANIVVPARLGDFVRLFILKHEKQMPYTSGFTALIAERVYDILIIAVLGLCSLPFLISLIPKEYEWFIWLMVAVIACGAAGVAVLVAARKLHAENTIIKKVLEIFAQFRTVSGTPGAFGLLSATSVIIWMMDVVICYIVTLMFGLTINFWLVLLAIVIGNLIKAVPITPGGIGTYELALVVVFEIGGVPAATATLVAVIDHLIKNGVTLLGGIVSLYYFGDWSVSLFKRLFKEDKKILTEEHDDR
ncbi:MAG: lysylphosphatidylglycerol synthase transmembrane domain-containing protein [Methanocorpusculum sp.]|nr:lysylphosphatidylglycerol synthase transmembrane domain-containing protein [Methanocorpusculum sp.]